jgi:hypothetical protein
MMQYLTSGQVPEIDDDARKIVLSSTNYVIQDGVLYHFHILRTKKIAKSTAIEIQLCVSTSLRPEVASGLNERNGHIAFDRLYALASKKLF